MKLLERRDSSQWRRKAIFAIVTLWVVVQGIPVTAADNKAGKTVSDLATFTKTVKPFLQQHCIDCHGDKKAKAKLRLDNLEPEFLSRASAAKWIEVMDQLNLGQMPPEEKPRPAIEQLATVAEWIAKELRAAERQQRSSGGRVLLRRMNRAEYANTMRDLLGVRFLPGESPLDLLPPDGTAEGFDKVATALMLDSSLLENYFEVATRIANDALVDGPPEFPTKTMRYELEDTAKNRAIDYLCAARGIECRENDIMLMQGSTRSYGVMKYGNTRKEIPTTGMYRIRVRAWGTKGEDGEPVIMRMRQNHPEADRQILIETTVTDEPKIYEIIVARDPKCGEYNVSIVNESGFERSSRVGSTLLREQERTGKAGDFEKTLRLQSRQQLEALTRGQPMAETADTSKLRKLYVDWIECEGPLYEQWPPKSHETVLFRGKDAKQDAEYVTAIFSRFMTRAFRRPATDAEVARIAKLVNDEIADGASFNDGIRVGLAAVLCSPKFLYLVEPSSTPDLPAVEPRALNNWELATRLSYFLWSSMPDDELFDLARSGRLNDRDELVRQVNRMIADDKAEGFVQGFGSQWLKTDSFLAFAPDERLYRDFNDKLGKAMVGEALAFFKEVLRKDESVRAFIDSDWTMVNAVLAKFYGIPGVKGDHFRRVPLPANAHRGGILGMAGVAMAGSDGVRTKPVSRGVYVREVLFNDPPLPPPPNAGEVEPNIKGEKLTVRQRLIQHQQIESCAACHKRIDCYGLALENFNAIGQWRTEQDGENFRRGNSPAIDASGTLPNGKAFASFDEFKGLLLEQEERFARGLSEKMLIYAMGRPMEPTDRTLVTSLVNEMSKNKMTLRSLIHAIVTSKTFLQK